MKRLGVLFCCLVAGMLSAAPGKMVVVVESFVARDGSGAQAGDIGRLRDHIVNIVQNSRKFEVAEREQLKTLLKEHALVDAGLTEGPAPESNRLTAAGFSILGSVLRCECREVNAGGDLYDRAVLEVQLRLADVESGKVKAVKLVKSEKTMMRAGAGDQRTHVLAAAIEDTARNIVNALVELAYPVTVLSVNSRFVTVNLAAEQTEEGEVFEVFELGDELTDPATGESLGFDEELVGKISVSRPGPKTTKCVPCADTKLADIQKGMILRKVHEEKVRREKIETQMNPLRSLR